MRRTNLLAAILIAPLLALIVASFLVPVGMTLLTAVSDREVSEALPRTAALVRAWDGQGLPPEEAYAEIARELGSALEERRIGGVAQRLNFERTGLRTLLLRTARAHDTLSAPFKQSLIALDSRWGEPELWQLIRRSSGPLTSLYLLRSLDHTLTPAGAVVPVDPDEAIYLTLFGRTLFVSIVVTLACILLAYPVAYTIARLKAPWSSLALTLVLIPFWSSILVRATAWFVLLQREGPVNALLLAAQLVDHPLQLVGTRTAVYLAMVHALLPFAVLPAYAVLRRIDGNYLRAAASLGAGEWQRFCRVTLPLSLPGVLAGGLMVFLLAVGFYVTPALVGGPRDQMVAFFVAFFMNQTVNWGMSSALAALLLAMTLGIVLLARLLVPGFRMAGVKL
jgi:putative spermidine/putrescine transport system permease protein